MQIGVRYYILKLNLIDSFRYIYFNYGRFNFKYFGANNFSNLYLSCILKLFFSRIIIYLKDFHEIFLVNLEKKGTMYKKLHFQPPLHTMEKEFIKNAK